MADPRTFWLTVMNVALGAAVILCLLATAAALFCHLLSRAIRRRSIETQLDRDMQRMFGPPRP
ncbi:MAG: hypothetical protein ABSC23_13410 [Bryobacteraceae bacterium]